MSCGFNSNVSRNERALHVQTEDRGPQHPAIDTVVYHNGHILYRHSFNYAEYAASPDFSPETLRERVEHQHREVIEDLRAGTLDDHIAAAEAQLAKTTGIQVQLLNPASWLASGRVALEVGVVRRSDNQPVPGAQIEAAIDGALRDGTHRGASDHQGRAKIEFELPPLGKGDLALVIQAQSESSKDEIRFAMRSRAKNPQASVSK
jgi:hypothetical protein